MNNHEATFAAAAMDLCCNIPLNKLSLKWREDLNCNDYASESKSKICGDGPLTYRYPETIAYKNFFPFCFLGCK